MPASYETHRAQLKAIVLAWGMPEDSAETTADVLSWADLHGVDSHGMSMIPGYDRLRRAGRANMQARPRIIKETPVSALVDGDGVFDTRAAGQGPGVSFTLQDTAGCSCSQILAAMGFGSGQAKYGCSTGTMEDWVELVAAP